MKERLVWIDCEMTGLDIVDDALIEVAALVTDFDLNVLGEGIDLVIKPPAEALDQMGDFVRSMHEKSGLLTELDAGLTMAEAEQQVLAYVREHCPDGSRPPLAGNTVATDRSFLSRDMPTLEGFLHYRIVDVSSIKELSRRWFPRAYFQAPTKRGNHRALADIQESIEELRYYREAVFVPSPGPDSETRPGHRREARRHAHRAAAAPPPEARAARRGRTDSAEPDPSPRLLVGPGTSRGRMVGVAQLVERRVVVADVAGSSPVTHPKPCRHRGRGRRSAAAGPGQRREHASGCSRQQELGTRRSAEAAMDGIGGRAS